MRHSTSTSERTESDNTGGTTIELALPIRESDLFKHGATPHVLNFLSDNPDVDVSLRQLSQVVPMSERATRAAVDVLAANDLVETFHEGNARRVHINRARLERPDDPILSIPQAEYQTPVRVARRYLEETLEGIAGIVLFGSVARGDADRQSDVDLWVLVDGNHMQQRHDANELVTLLEDLQIPSTIARSPQANADFEENWTDIRARLEDQDHRWSSAQRYSFDIVVETPQSIVGQSDRVDAERLFGEGITLRSTETLERVKREIVGDE